MHTALAQRPFALPLTIPSTEFQNEYKHLHHASSLRLLEAARLGFLEALGYPNSWFVEQGVLLVVTNIRISYHREVRGADVVATCESAVLDGKSIVMEQVLYNERNKRSVVATVECVGMDAATRRACAVPAEFAARVDSWMSARP